MIGMVWFLLLVSVPSGFVYVCGLIVGIAVSVRVSGLAEKLLGQKDPSSVVVDEIVAVPFCFLTWIAALWLKYGHWPSAGVFLTWNTWPYTLVLLVAFRVFDIAKPWPVRQSQCLKGGWGITADDLLAAAYVNLCVLVAMSIGFWPR